MPPEEDHGEGMSEEIHGCFLVGGVIKGRWEWKNMKIIYSLTSSSKDQGYLWEFLTFLGKMIRGRKVS